MVDFCDSRWFQFFGVDGFVVGLGCFVWFFFHLPPFKGGSGCLKVVLMSF